MFFHGLPLFSGSIRLDLRAKDGMHDVDRLNHPWAITIAFKTSVFTRYDAGMNIKYKHWFNTMKNCAKSSKVSFRLKNNINANALTPVNASKVQERTVIWILIAAFLRRYSFSSSAMLWRNRLFWDLKKWLYIIISVFWNSIYFISFCA